MSRTLVLVDLSDSYTHDEIKSIFAHDKPTPEYRILPPIESEVLAQQAPLTEHEPDTRIAEIIEVLAGMEGFISETAPEAYLQRVIDQIEKIAMSAQQAPIAPQVVDESELFRLTTGAFITCNSADGKGWVEIKFQTLKQAQDLHCWLVSPLSGGDTASANTPAGPDDTDLLWECLHMTTSPYDQDRETALREKLRARLGTPPSTIGDKS